MGDRDVLKEEAEQRTTQHPLISSPEPQVELNIGSSSDDAQPELGCFSFPQETISMLKTGQQSSLVTTDGPQRGQ